MPHASKIAQELIDATDLSNVRNETAALFAARLVKAVHALPEADWDRLGQPAQDWFNAAVDAKNNKEEELPGFPDIEAAEEQATPRRRGAAAEERLIKVGDTATVKNKRGREVTGEVLELSATLIVLKGPEGEEEFSMDRVESVHVNHGTAGQQEDEPRAPEIEVGATVALKTLRGREVEGKVIELTDDMIVLDVDGKEEEFNRERVDTIAVKGGTKPAGRPRGGSAAAGGAEDGKPRRSSNPAGVSAGQRTREIMAEHKDISEADVGKMLKAEKIEFKDSSLRMNYGDNKKFLEALAEHKRLK